MKYLIKKIRNTSFFILIIFSSVFSYFGISFGQAAVKIESIDSSRFPVIYSNVNVFDGDTAITDLIDNDFQVFEDGRPQFDSLQITPPNISNGVRLADIVFIIDVSGSMGSSIANVRSNVTSFANSLAASNVNFALGLVRFGNGSGPNPEIFNAGNLNTNVEDFLSLVNTLYASGGYEPSFLALRQAALGFNFRAGAQKIFVLITDEDSDDRSKTETIDLMLANDITVHVAANCNSGNSNSDFCDDSSVRTATGGLLFSVTESYGPVLDAIAESTSSTYVIRYKTDNPLIDGQERTVGVEANVNGIPGYGTGTYTPGAEPQITITPETETLISKNWPAGSTLLITAKVVDEFPPTVETVKLHYRTIGNLYTSVSMTLTESSIWVGSIPGSIVQEPGVEFYITASDGQSSSSSPEDPAYEPYALAVLPNEAPTIEMLVRFNPETALPEGQPLPISASIQDDTNKISTVSLHFRNPADLIWRDIQWNVDSESFLLETEIPAEFIKEPRIDFYISATDDYGVTRTYGANGSVIGSDDPIILPVGQPRQQVLFIHGIMGSHLFEKLLGFDNRRWLIFDDSEIKKALELNTQGKSTKDIYTKQEVDESGSGGGLIAEAEIGSYQINALNIYKTFIKEKLSKDNDPNRSWSYFIYDWRLSFKDRMTMNPEGDLCGSISSEEYPDVDDHVVEDGGYCTRSILGALREKISKMASEDPDGKVDIVAHSMGGLLSKYYITQNASDSKIGKLILVDVPQLGTPGGAAVVMNGEHSLVSGMVGSLLHKTMRHLSQNMISAYYLTPNPSYFDTQVSKEYPLFDGTISRSPGCIMYYPVESIESMEEFKQRFPYGIRNFDQWSNFIYEPGNLGTKDNSNYERPLSADILGYNRKYAFNEGFKLHTNHIGLQWDSGDVENVYQIVGENLNTLVGIKYKAGFDGLFCDEVDYEPIEGPVGDGTVVRESQELLDVPTYYIDLNTYNCSHIDRNHANILEVDWTREQIDSLLSGHTDLVEKKADPCGGWGENIAYTSTEPSDRKIQWVKFKIKSPVDVHVTDSVGNHTGPTTFGYETKIPNSTYYLVNTHKYVSLPLGYDDLVVEFRGTDSGYFSLTIEQYNHTELVKTLDFLDIPVTTLYRGRIIFKQFENIVSIETDIDGDGSYESNTFPATDITANVKGANFIDRMNITVANLTLSADPTGNYFQGSGKFVTTDSTYSPPVVISKVEFDKVNIVHNVSDGQLTIEAPCQVDNNDGYMCTITLFDGGKPGKGKDHFSLEVVGRGADIFRTSGTLKGGEVSISIR